MILIGITKILDEEKILNKRLISEMIHIKKQKYGLNLQNDTSLDPLYENLFTMTMLPSCLLYTFSTFEIISHLVSDKRTINSEFG